MSALFGRMGVTHRWGELELQDVEAGTDWLRRKPWIDKKRVFATGGIVVDPATGDLFAALLVDVGGLDPGDRLFLGVELQQHLLARVA